MLDRATGEELIQRSVIAKIFRPVDKILGYGSAHGKVFQDCFDGSIETLGIDLNKFAYASIVFLAIAGRHTTLFS
jgi:hypothetical protein